MKQCKDSISKIIKMNDIHVGTNKTIGTCSKIKIDERIEQMQFVKLQQREKFKAVSNTVWVCWKAMIKNKTIKSE